jgi:glycosyl transferase family 25
MPADRQSEGLNRGRQTRVFVISMRDSTGRRAAFVDRAKNATIPWKFFDACTGLVPGLSYDGAERKILGRDLTAGEIGCYASHYALWKRLLDDDADQYVILEDDVIVDWKFLAKLAEVDFGASGIDYLRLYCLRPSPLKVAKYRFLENRHLLELIDPAFGTQGYVITRAGAERFATHSRRIIRSIDTQMDRYWEHGIPNLCLFPFPIIEELGASRIGGERFKVSGRSRKVRLARTAGYMWDRVKSRAWLLRRRRLRVSEPRQFGD